VSPLLHLPLGALPAAAPHLRNEEGRGGRVATCQSGRGRARAWKGGGDFLSSILKACPCDGLASESGNGLMRASLGW
jgi:hypothetical protein